MFREVASRFRVILTREMNKGVPNSAEMCEKILTQRRMFVNIDANNIRIKIMKV